VKILVRTAIGFALFAGGLTLLVYGIAQAIQMGSCGTDGYGQSIGPACPSGLGPMILLMIAGTFVVIVGTVTAARGGGLVIRLVATAVVAVLAGVVLGFADLDDTDSRPGPQIIAAVLAPMLLFAVPGIRLAPRRSVSDAAPAPVGTPAPATATADELAARLRQLKQLRESGLLDEDAYKERRKQILAEL
jgi:hypothetical protein